MIENNFRNAMEQTGLYTNEALIGDGILHRFHVDGDTRGKKNGWYVLHSDGVASGCFGSWKIGETHSWCLKDTRHLTPAERRDNNDRKDKALQLREAEEKRRQGKAQSKALYIWASTVEATDSHPYLVKKKVTNHGLRIHKGLLTIPLLDNSGTLHSLQFINGDGGKRFLSGGRKRGCYFTIGSPSETICIAEGYATAASIYVATGHAVAIAFDAGNLLPVSKEVRKKYPKFKIVLCADNDATTEGNPGLTKAREAAVSIGAFLAIPPAPGDFNDFIGGAAHE